MNPPNLTEVLGVTPFYHLVPKQDLAPLFSFSRVQPQALEPKDFLAPEANKLIHLAKQEYENDNNAVKGLVDRLLTKFREFNDSELDGLKFKRPVIAGDNDAQPELPPVSRIFNGLYSNADCVSEDDLVEFRDDLEFPDYAEERLHLLNGSESDEKVMQHVMLYKEKLDRELACEESKRKKPRLFQPGISRINRSRSALDRSKLKDSRLIELYEFLDQISSGHEAEINPEASLNSSFKILDYTLATDENGLTLTSTGLRYISRYISELTESSSLEECHSDYLKVIQTLCYSTINHAKCRLKSDQSIAIQQSLEASSILLIILNTNLQHRELYLQSYINCIVGNLSNVLPRIMSPSMFEALIGNAIDCLEKLSIYLTVSTADDNILTEVEYMCIKMIYMEHEVKNSEQLRNIILEIILRVFKAYPSQRQFIVNEMLSNISKLTDQKGLLRDIPLPRGVRVLFFTVFLVELVQSFDACDFRKEISSLLSLPKSGNPIGSTNVKRDLILTGIGAVLEDAQNIANQVAEFFLSRISTAESIYKTVFLGLIDDLCVMMSNPQWPGAETVLSNIVRFQISAMNAQKVNALEEPFILEIIGKFGSKCLDLLLKETDSNTLDNFSSSENILHLCDFHKSVLQHLKAQTTKNPQATSLFQFQLLKTIVFYKGLYANSISGKTLNQFFTIISSEDQQLSQESMRILEIIDLHLSFLENFPFSGQSLDISLNPNKPYRLLSLATTFRNDYNDFLVLLTTSLESSKVKLAAKAIRTLSPLVTKDPKILLHQRINSSISKILTKGSALSKDAVIDLLGQYMFSSKELILKYYNLIGNRSSDEGILVRKRVLKIMKNVFGATDNLEVMCVSASKILKRLEDEESSIVEAAKTALRDLFFETHDVSKVSEVMINLTNSGQDTRCLLVSFIHQELRLSRLGSQRREKLREILNVAFDHVAELNDSTGVEKTGVAFGFIVALAECDSNLVTQDQLISLQPFLIEDVFDKELLCLSALKVLKLVLPSMKTLRPEYVSGTNSILLKRLTKFNTKELHEAIQIIVVFSRISTDTPLLKAAIASLKLLWPFIQTTHKNASEKDLPKIRKVIHLLGCFGSYCNFEYARKLFMNSNVGLREKESIISLIVRYLLYFCQPSIDTATRAISIRNILCVAARHPTLLLSETILGVFDVEFRSSVPWCKLEIVKGLTFFLQQEDQNLLKKNENDVASTKRSKIEKNDFLVQDSQNIADGVCSSVVQKYLSNILCLCLHDASEIGEAAVDFLRVVATLGFANPKLCISTIIALEASLNKTIKKVATCLHLDIFEKHESLADRNYVEAIRLACDYSKRTMQGGHLHNQSFLRSVYRIINTNYLARKKFVNTIARLFHVRLSTEDLSEAIASRDIAVFLVLNLLVLNFASMEEVCLLMFHLDRFIRGEVIDLAEKISATISCADGKGMSISNLQLLFVFLQTALSFILLKQNLAASYSIRSVMMEGFRPSKPEVELRQPPKIVAFVDYPLSELALQTKLSSPGTFGGIFTRLVQSTNAYMT